MQIFNKELKNNKMISKKIIGSVLSLLLVCNMAFAQTLDRSIRPKPGPAPVVQMGDAESFVSSNGIKVYVVENHKLPKVSYSIDLDVKPALEKDKIGAAGFVGDLLKAGSTNMSKNDFNKAIDMIGGTISVSSEGMYFGSLKKHSNKLLALASDMLLNPSFPQNELDLQKKKSLSGLATEKDDPQAMSRNLGAMLNYGPGHYRGEVMTEASVGNVNMSDVKNYYNTYFRPNVAYMAIVGDITLAEAKVQVEKYFGAWKKQDVPSATYATPEPNTGAKVGIVNKSGAVQSVVKVTYPLDLKPGNEDVIPLKVANGVLGGGATGRLFQNLREKHAWTYGSYSGVRTSKWANSGSFSASANSTAEATDSSVVEILKEMNRMRNEKVSEEELEGYKNYMAGTFALGLENPRTLASFAINIAKNNLPKDYYKNYLKNIEKVTADDVMRVSKKYIKPGVAHITVAGDKNSNMKKLEKFGPVTVYDVYGNPVTDEPAAAVPTNITARDIVQKHVDATGGTSKWKAIKDIKMVSGMQMQGMDISITSIKKEGGKLFEEVSAAMGTLQKTVFNGKTGKSSSMQGSAAIEGDAIAATQKKAVIFDEEQYLDDSHTLKLNGTEKVDGEDCYIVAITDAAGEKSTEFYSMETGLRVQSVNTMEMQGQKITVTTKIGDYKEVDGMKFPYSIKQNMGPQKMDIKVKTIEINKGVDDKTFEAE